MEEKNLDKEALVSIYKNAHIGLQSISNIIKPNSKTNTRVTKNTSANCAPS